MYEMTTYPSPLGHITLACEGDCLAGLWLEGQKYYGAGILKEAKENSASAIFRDTKEWLDRYFAGRKPIPSELPLAPAGSDFRQAVWHILCEIPYGKVITYGDIAKKMAAQMNIKSMSAQAVGGAVGHNPISIIIPCHRVVGTNGSLTGYAGGIDKKQKLLTLESGGNR